MVIPGVGFYQSSGGGTPGIPIVIGQITAVVDTSPITATVGITQITATVRPLSIIANTG